MGLTIACGFVLTKKGLFPPAASKGLSQISMNIALPALLFSSMVPSFNSSNVAGMGPLSLVAILYQLFGAIAAFVIRDLFYVPPNFQWGILCLLSMSNWGNLPTAIVQSVGTDTPFNPATDPTIGIAYISVFILIMNVTFYGTGLYRICGWDMDESNQAEVPTTLAGRIAKRKRQFSSLLQRISRGRHEHKRDDGDSSGITEKAAQMMQKMTPTPLPQLEQLRSKEEHAPPLAFETPDVGEPSIQPSEPSRPINQRSGSMQGPEEKKDVEAQIVQERQQAEEEAHEHPKQSMLKAILHSLNGLVTPITLGVIVSLPFALANPLKALIVDVDGYTAIPPAPDGKAPLNFIYEFAAFVGGMAIPTGLIILGSSFARLKISRARFKEMPLAAIFAAAIFKMILMPLIGTFLVIGLRSTTTLFPRDQKMLSFTAFLLAGTPSAVNQVVVTQIFAKDPRSLDTLASFLLVQYIFLIVQCAATTAISLWLVS